MNANDRKPLSERPRSAGDGTPDDTNRALDRLEALLDLSLASAVPVASPNDVARGLVLYGAGNLGRAILAKLRNAGVEPLAFADDTTAKQGCVIDGLQVLSPEAARCAFNGNITFGVTILNEALRFLDAKQRLHERTGQEVISFFQLGLMFPQALLPHLQYDRPEVIKSNAARLRDTLHILADKESQRQFLAHLEFRLTANYSVLPSRTILPYFPDDLIPRFTPNITFVDCGAYDGDTIRAFLSHQAGQFKSIVAVEPDKRNYDCLAAYVRSLGSQTASKIHLVRGAVGAQSGKVPFNATGDMSAAIASEADSDVEMFALDDLVRDLGSPSYIKLDVEGYELPALHGASNLLKSGWPTLAVSAYHRPADLWEIPLYLNTLEVGYRLYLRTEGDDGMDIVCYTLPRTYDRSKQA